MIDISLTNINADQIIGTPLLLTKGVEGCYIPTELKPIYHAVP